MNYILLSQNIKRARKEKHFTQEQLAELVNCSTVFISQIETGVRVPSLETLYNIADVLGVSFDYLFSEKNETPDSNIYKSAINKLIQTRSVKEMKLIFDVVNTICNGMDETKKEP
jgi:transcriptional regulator with XRE-family HTH domain